jgi:hypothetical protein
LDVQVLRPEQVRNHLTTIERLLPIEEEEHIDLDHAKNLNVHQRDRRLLDLAGAPLRALRHGLILK